MKEEKIVKPATIFKVNGQDVGMLNEHINVHVPHIIIGINLHGKPYWEECKNVFNMDKEFVDKIEATF